MRHFAILAAAELAFGALAPAADYTVVNNTPPGYTVVNKSPACICGDSCKCKPGVCPGKCPVEAPAPRPTTPAGYHVEYAPDGRAWYVRDGYTLEQSPEYRATLAAPVVNRPVTPAQNYRLEYRCTGQKCEWVKVPVN